MSQQPGGFSFPSASEHVSSRVCLGTALRGEEGYLKMTVQSPPGYLDAGCSRHKDREISSQWGRLCDPRGGGDDRVGGVWAPAFSSPSCVCTQAALFPAHPSASPSVSILPPTLLRRSLLLEALFAPVVKERA